MTMLQVQGNGTVSTGKGKGLAEALDRPPVSSSGRVVVGRPAKGNREWSDEIQTKADELERLFASHTIRVRGGRTGSAHAKKMLELQSDSSPATPAKSVVDDDTNDGEMGFRGNYDRSDGGGTSSANSRIRGEFYGRYQEKRDAKLMEEWRLEGDVKEAELKAMQDRLVLCWAEMKAAKFSGPVENRDPSAIARRRRTEMSRALRDRDPRSGEQDQIILAGGASFGNGSSDGVISRGKSHDTSNDDPSKGAISKKAVSSIRSTASPVPVKPTGLPAKPSSRPASVAATRRQQPEQPVNSTATATKPPELRKQTRKPSIGIGKASHRAQSEAKDAKPRRSPVKKSSVRPVDFSDSTSREPDSAPAKSSREHPNRSGVQEAIGEGRGEEPSPENCTMEQPPYSTPSDNTGDDRDSKASAQEVEDPSSSDKEEQQPEVPSAQVAPRTDDSVHSNTLELDIDTASMSSPREEHHPEPLSSPAVAELNIAATMEDPLMHTTTASPRLHPLNWATETGSALLGRWATADELTFAANAPRQARKKDVASGLRWLLRFGRRSKGSAAAATPLGEQSNQSFVDSVQRSRMEFAQHHSLHGCFPANEGFDSRGT